MTGAFRTYRPVTADDLEPLEARIASVLGPAIRWQLWLFFPPSTFGGDGLSMPCDDLPRRPPADAADVLFTMIDAVARHTAHTELIIALERRGSPDPGRLDRDWMRGSSPWKWCNG